MNLTAKDLLGMEHIRALNFDMLKGKRFSGVSTDSRTVMQRELFFALRGETFDGHEFVAKAFERGSACVVVDERASVARHHRQPILVVKDTTKALGQLANIYRKKFDIPFIAVAGSNGKTTTKEMIATVLGKKYPVLNTQGNLNNHIGVPQI